MSDYTRESYFLQRRMPPGGGIAGEMWFTSAANLAEGYAVPSKALHDGWVYSAGVRRSSNRLLRVSGSERSMHTLSLP